MAFNNRPDQLAAKQALIDKLQSQVTQITAELADVQANMPSSESDEQCSLDQLCDDLRWAEAQAVEQKQLYDDLKGWHAKSRFRSKRRGDVLKKLVEIQCASLQVANATVSEINFKIFCCMLEGSDESKSLMIDELMADLEAMPIDDRFCTRYIDRVLTGC